MEIHVEFADGPGQYQLEVFNDRKVPLKKIFDQKVVATKDAWVEWDAKDEAGRDVPIGTYPVIFYRNGKPLKSITLYRLSPH